MKLKKRIKLLEAKVGELETCLMRLLDKANSAAERALGACHSLAVFRQTDTQRVSKLEDDVAELLNVKLNEEPLPEEPLPF